MKDRTAQAQIAELRSEVQRLRGNVNSLSSNVYGQSDPNRRDLHLWADAVTEVDDFGDPMWVPVVTSAGRRVWTSHIRVSDYDAAVRLAHKRINRAIDDLFGGNQ